MLSGDSHRSLFVGIKFFASFLIGDFGDFAGALVCIHQPESQSLESHGEKLSHRNLFSVTHKVLHAIGDASSSSSMVMSPIEV